MFSPTYYPVMLKTEKEERDNKRWDHFLMSYLSGIFLSWLFAIKPKYTYTKISLRFVVHLIIIDQWNQTAVTSEGYL